MLKLLAVLCTAACAYAADTTLITFDGAAGTTHSFKAVSDPVMGGQSHSTFAVNNSVGVFSGEVKIVPSLKAPGFCNMQADKSTYPDISMHTHLMLKVRSVGAAYGAWKVAFGPADHSGSFFFSSYKADFAINGSAWQVVSIPFTSFSSKWSSYTGEPTTKCSDDKEVCPSAKRLAGITTFEIAAEGAAGKFELEVQKVWAGDGNTGDAEYMVEAVAEAATADTTYFRIDQTTCADISLGSTVGICPTSLVVKLGKLAAGSCASQGYTKAGSPLSQKAGPCGTLHFNTYTKAAKAEVAEAFTASEAASNCTTVAPISGLNFTEFLRATWFVQKQQETGYLKPADFFCVTATYNDEGKKTLGGLGAKAISVYNYQNSGAVNGKPGGAITGKGSIVLCAREQDKSVPSKLLVAPCFLPNFLAGDYWVVGIGEDAATKKHAWAIVSGGQPTVEYADGCTTKKTGTNGSGFWFFTRAQVATPAVLAEMEAAAKKLGFTTSQLIDVPQAGCKYAEAKLVKPN